MAKSVNGYAFLRVKKKGNHQKLREKASLCLLCPYPFSFVLCANYSSIKSPSDETLTPLCYNSSSFIVPCPHRCDYNASAGNPSSGTPNPPSVVTISGSYSLRSVAVDAPLCRCSSLPSLQNPNPLTPSAPLPSCFLLLVSLLLCKSLSKSDGYVVTKPRMTKTSDEALTCCPGQEV
nr:uncharacterized protein LOC112723113 [Arachis hypogaea]